MAGLVLELQAEAIDHKTSVSELLRKALVVSKKLGLSHIENWLGHELNGYSPGVEIPPYRHIRGQIKVWNPYHGWQPLHFGDPEMGERLSTCPVGQPIGELDSLKPKSGQGLQIHFSEAIKNQLIEGMEVALEPTLHVSHAEVVGILDAVRNNVLKWALQLEQEGILGEGMSFSREEKRAAGQISYNITNNIGSMQNSQLQQASPGAGQEVSVENNLSELVNIVTDIKNTIKSLALSLESAQELESEIATVLTQAQSPKPKAAILREAVRSIRNILEGTTGSLIASGLLAQLGRFG